MTDIQSTADIEQIAEDEDSCLSLSVHPIARYLSGEYTEKTSKESEKK